MGYSLDKDETLNSLARDMHACNLKHEFYKPCKSCQGKTTVVYDNAEHFCKDCNGRGSEFDRELLYQRLCHIVREAMEIFDLDREHPIEDLKAYTGRPGVPDSDMARKYNAVCRPKVPDKHLPYHPAIAVEIADTILRLLDLGFYLDLDVGLALVDKLRFNWDREVKHGKRH